MSYLEEKLREFVNEDLKISPSKERTAANLGAYVRGMIEAIDAFSIWKDGHQYIGSPEKDIRGIMIEIHNAYKILMSEIYLETNQQNN